VTEPVHIVLPCSCDASGLADFLTGRGLTATLTTSDDHCELEVRDAVDPDVRLRHEVGAALAAWLERGDHALVPALTHEHEYVLRPPAD